MKNLTTDPVIDEGIAAAVSAALEAEDPVAALERNLGRLAKEIAGRNASNGHHVPWERVFAQDGQCGCAPEAATDIGIETLADMDDREFADATQGKRWEKLMG